MNIKIFVTKKDNDQCAGNNTKNNNYYQYNCISQQVKTKVKHPVTKGVRPLYLYPEKRIQCQLLFKKPNSYHELE
ncbi:hypothetical protein [uncultured Desulfobacter sp.]|uniref:hypothetical protein n=1 Tax=uncultured Desulfobacter sp. TaxID=240139 RepID=UPI0029F5AF7A|nr:hypothetical protein [uncultured Desulfobacter sp.]